MKGLLLALVGLVIGTWGSLCGIGGGIFAVPVFHYALRMPLPQAIANSLVLVAVMTTGGTLVELLRADCAIAWDVLGALVATSWLGTHVGMWIGRRLSVRALKRVFAVLIALVSLEMFLTEPLRASPQALEWSAGLLVLVLLLGFAAGILAPLFGLGGGLIAVPGLLYGLPELGYVGARATSTAMSTFNAWQSLILQRKQGHLRLGEALPPALGAFVGSYVGVWLAHRPEIAVPAQRLIALTLLLISVRFFLDRK
ncbi:MAG: hypothetical protein RL277_1112 [Planctomycetota bacterium]